MEITKEKVKFAKGYEQNFSTEIFRVAKVIQRVTQPVYELTELQDRPIEGLFYNYELLKVTVSPQTELGIDKIVRARNKDGIKQHFVKWRVYEEAFNSWINSTDIKKIWIILCNNAIRHFRLLFPANRIADFRRKLATPLQLEHEKWEVGLVEISYPKGYKKRYLHNTPRLGSEHIIFPVKHYEPVFDLTNIPQFFEPSANENFIRIFSNHINKYEGQ